MAARKSTKFVNKIAREGAVPYGRYIKMQRQRDHPKNIFLAGVERENAVQKSFPLKLAFFFVSISVGNFFEPHVRLDASEGNHSLGRVMAPVRNRALARNFINKIWTFFVLYIIVEAIQNHLFSLSDQKGKGSTVKKAGESATFARLRPL